MFVVNATIFSRFIFLTSMHVPIMNIYITAFWISLWKSQFSYAAIKHIQPYYIKMRFKKQNNTILDKESQQCKINLYTSY